MKILITGAFGFVGSNLSAYLAAKGHELWALDVDPVGNRQLAVGGGQSAIGSKQSAIGNKQSAISSRQSEGEEFFRQDAKAQREGEVNAQRSTLNAQRSSSGHGAYARCFDWGQLTEIPWGEVDAVIHLAGKAHDTRNASDPQSYFDINVGLTEKVLEAAVSSWQWAMGNGQWAVDNGDSSRKDAKAQRKFIFFSSVKAVADRVDGVLTEEATPDPKTPYGQSKLEAERVVQSAVGSQQSAVVSYILRPCMIHGPGNKGNLNLLYGAVKKRIPWPLGAFENRRTFTSIGNLCAVIEALLKGDVPSGVYQMADDEALSTNELIGLMAESLGNPARILHMPARWIRWIASWGDRLHLPLNSERLKKLTESYVVSNARLKQALGWREMPVRARDGLVKTLRSFS